ncbi:hyaluronidase-4-like [Rhinoraja longicauda]
MDWTWCGRGWLPAACPVYTALCLLSLTSVAQGVSRKQVMPPLVEGQPFQVYWNVPTSRCSTHRGVNLHLADFGIVTNTKEKFIGEKITIFYAGRLGIYPSYQHGGPENGGLPQNTSLEAHLRRARVDIDNFLPEDYEGLAVIDWEDWRPLYARNWGSKTVYKTKSQELVRGRNPKWNQSQIKTEAKKEFDQAAREYMSSSLKLGQSMRPKAYWGFYLFPDCYNYHHRDEFPTYSGHCPDIEIRRNDELTWMWTQSSALFPSVYLEEKLKSERGKLYARYRIQEAMRVALLTKEQFAPPVFLYCRSHYIDSKPLKPLNEKMQKLKNTYDRIQERPLPRSCQTLEWASHKLTMSFESSKLLHSDCCTLLSALCTCTNIFCTLVFFSLRYLVSTGYGMIVLMPGII